MRFTIEMGQDSGYWIRRQGQAMGSMSFTFSEAFAQLEQIVGERRGYIRSATFDVVEDAGD